MAKPNSIELPDCKPIRILYEDRTVIAVDEPPGWMLTQGLLEPPRKEWRKS